MTAIERAKIRKVGQTNKGRGGYVTSYKHSKGCKHWGGSSVEVTLLEKVKWTVLPSTRKIRMKFQKKG